jgi:streptogramin lyase
MSSDLRERDVREFLDRMAAEMPTPMQVPPGAMRRVRGRLARTAIAGVLVVVLVAAGSITGVRVLLRAEPTRPADDTRHEPIVAIPIVAGDPIDVAVGEGAVWVSGHGVFRIDPATAEIAASFPSQGRRLGSRLAVGESAVWVSGGAFDGEILRIDPEMNEIVATIHMGSYRDPYALAAGNGAVWATTHQDGRLLHVDPATNTVEAIPAPRSAVHGVAAIGGIVWIAASDWDDGNGELFGFDPGSGAFSEPIPHVRVFDLISAGFGSLWGFASGDGSVIRIDTSGGSVLARIDVGFDSNAENGRLAIGEGAVWVSDGCCNIYRIDPATNEITAALAFDKPVHGLAAGEGAVWVADGSETVYRIDLSAFSDAQSPATEDGEAYDGGG